MPPTEKTTGTTTSFETAAGSVLRISAWKVIRNEDAPVVDQRQRRQVQIDDILDQRSTTVGNSMCRSIPAWPTGYR